MTKLHLNLAFTFGQETRGEARSAAPEHTPPPPELEPAPLPDNRLELELPEDFWREPEAQPPPVAPEPETPRQTAESSPPAEDREKIVITLDEVKNVIVSQLEGRAVIKRLELTGDAFGRLALAAELDAGLLGGKISITGIIINDGNEIAVANLDVQARGYVKTRIEDKLSHFYPEIKTYFENRFGEPITGIQIVHHGLELTFAASPIPAAAQAHAEPAPHPEPAADPEAGTTLQPESDETVDPELARLEHDLNAARLEYARLSVVAEKQEKSRPRARTPADDGAPTPSGEGRPKIRINLLREDLASESAGKIRGAQKTYRDALNALRLYDARLLQENPAGLMPGELQKEAKKQFLAFTLREANRLYDEKTDISIAEKPQLARAAAEGIENLRRSPAGAKLIMSSGIFGGLSMIDFFAFLRGDLPLFTETGDPTGAQHALAGILLAKAGQSITKGYQKGKTRVEVGRAMRKEQREHNGDLLAALLDADNERLNDLMLAQAARKSDEKKKRAVAAAVSGLIGYMASSIFG